MYFIFISFSISQYFLSRWCTSCLAAKIKIRVQSLGRVVCGGLRKHRAHVYYHLRGCFDCGVKIVQQKIKAKKMQVKLRTSSQVFNSYISSCQILLLRYLFHTGDQRKIKLKAFILQFCAYSHHKYFPSHQAGLLY